MSFHSPSTHQTSSLCMIANHFCHEISTLFYFKSPSTLFLTSLFFPSDLLFIIDSSRVILEFSISGVFQRIGLKHCDYFHFLLCHWFCVSKCVVKLAQTFFERLSNHF